jgi:uncharacterized membrane protein
MKVRGKHVGALGGLLFGWAILQYGFYQAVFLVALALLGWWAGKLLDGEAPLLDYLQRRRDEHLD